MDAHNAPLLHQHHLKASGTGHAGKSFHFVADVLELSRSFLRQLADRIRTRPSQADTGSGAHNAREEFSSVHGVLLFCMCASWIVSPGCPDARPVGETKVYILVKFNLLVEHPGFDHEIAHQVEVLLAGRELAVHHPVQGLVRAQRSSAGFWL